MATMLAASVFGSDLLLLLERFGIDLSLAGSFENLKRIFMDHRKRLDWARHHIQALEDEIDTYLTAEPPPQAMTLSLDEERGRYTVKLYVKRAIPAERWSLMVSDAVHSLRSTLDNLAFALCTADLGRSLTQDEAQRVQFIIADSFEVFKKDRDRRRPHLPVSDRVWTGMERAQPYRGRHVGTIPYLTALRNISNVDKHRRILVVGEGATDAGIRVVTATGLEWGLSGWRGRLINETEMFSFTPSEIGLLPTDYHIPMSVKGNLTFDIRFQQGWPGYASSAMGFLRGTAKHIEDNVFRWLEPLL